MYGGECAYTLPNKHVCVLKRHKWVPCYTPVPASLCMHGILLCLLCWIVILHCIIMCVAYTRTGNELPDFQNICRTVAGADGDVPSKAPAQTLWTLTASKRVKPLPALIRACSHKESIWYTVTQPAVTSSSLDQTLTHHAASQEKAQALCCRTPTSSERKGGMSSGSRS